MPFYAHATDKQKLQHLLVFNLQLASTNLL